MQVYGKGTFGMVYKARCREDSEIVAIKKVFQDKSFLNRELEILRTLNHPNIIHLKHFFFSKEETNINNHYLNLVTDFYPETVPRIQTFFTKKKQNLPFLLTKLYAF